MKSKSGFVSANGLHGSTFLYPDLLAYKSAMVDRHIPDRVAYGRYGSFMAKEFEKRIAAMEAGYAAMTTCSGLSAITTSLLAYIAPGKHILVPDTVFGPVRKFCDGFLAQIGVDVSYYDADIGAGLQQLLRPDTCLIYLESPGSITFEIQDVDAIAALGKKHNVPTIMDNTWATPNHFQPLEHGINVSVHAATKYIGGHSDLLLGVIVCDEENWHRIRDCQLQFGHCAGEQEIAMALRGLDTLDVRLERHFYSGMNVARWLEHHALVDRVFFPALESSNDYGLWKQYFSGGNGLVTFSLSKLSNSQVEKFVANLNEFRVGSGWGGHESLIMPVDQASLPSRHRELVRGHVFRLSVGLEPSEILIRDLDKALSTLS